MDNIKEIWKKSITVPNYEVSNLGRIRHADKGNIRKPQDNGNGYKYIRVIEDGKHKNYYVHRLVAEVFLSNPNNYPQINHIDHNRENNAVSNLEYCTAKYNCNQELHKQRLSENRKGKCVGGNNGMARALVCDGNIFATVKECAKYCGYSTVSLNNWLKGKVPMPKEFQVRGLAYADSLNVELQEVA